MTLRKLHRWADELAEEHGLSYQNDGDLRMLGAVDGYVSTLVHLRQNVKTMVWHHYMKPIHPRHVRKLADRERRLAPLKMMEKWLEDRIRETQAAYQATRQG